MDGRLGCLAEMIKMAGICLPIKEGVESTAVESPVLYQVLS